MRFRFYTRLLLVLPVLIPFAIVKSGAQDNENGRHILRLADIMSGTQLRHMKLWFAGQSSNWELAAYELHQFRESLIEAASLYPGIPVTNITTMADPVEAVADAIKGKDTRKFETTFSSLTAGCNSCHQSMDRGYIVIRVPTASPFSDQVFPVQGRR